MHTVFDQAGHWIGDYDATGTAIQQAIWFDGMPVGLVRNAGNALDLHYVEADALGTPRVVIDPTRDVAVWRWDLGSEAFGESEPEQDPDGDDTLFVLDLRYPGQQYDSASGFNYNYFRDYDPSVGRYVQSDPIGLGGGISTYGYASASSLTRSDFLGLAPERVNFDRADPMYRSSQNYYLPQGTFTIMGHGDPDGERRLKVKNDWLTPEEIWADIRDEFIAGGYTTLRIAHCGAAVDGKNGESAAEAFSKLVRKDVPWAATVEATPHLYWLFGSGRVALGESSIAQGIPWSRFVNGSHISGPTQDDINLLRVIVVVPRGGKK